MNPRRLYRSRDRRLAGVAGGMAEYLDIDPTIMRILWILAGLLSVGFAILAYILLAIVIPDAPWSAAPTGAPMWGPAQAPGWTQPNAGWSQPTMGQAQATGWPPSASSWAPPASGGAQAAPSWADPANAWGSTAQPNGWGSPAQSPAPATQGRGIGGAAIVGIVLIAIGGIALLNVAIPGWIIPAASGPIVLILLGGAFLLASVRRTPHLAAVNAAPAPAAAAPTPSAASAVSPSPAGLTADVAAAQPDVVDDATAIDVPIVGASSEAGDAPIS